MATQDQIDRAHEWIGVNHPEVDGDAYEQLFAESLAEIVDLDAAADAADKKLGLES